jgi:mannose-1-phosphate guanylyltransferase/mannose-6-phosphate isomerase
MSKCLILAGGSGSRLWPLSRSHYPKQFLKLVGDFSFLQLTLMRALKLFKAEDIHIITHKEAYALVKSQALAIHPQLVEKIIIEPSPRNTAPAIAFAIEELEAQGCDVNTPLLVCPADHLVAPDEAFCKQIKQGYEHAAAGKIVTFGIRPTKPETGYGYIHAEGHTVLAFIEKPDQERALAFVLDGNYFWNAGIFLFKMSVMKEAFAQLAPNLAEPLSIDYAIMEKASNLAVVPLHLTWSDVGSWLSIYDLLEKDMQGNVKQGNVMALDTKNSLIISKKRLVTTIGLEDMIVVEAEDAVLVAPKSQAQKVKNLVGELQGCSQVQEPLTVERPWGSYTVLEEGNRFKIKRITVNPGAQLSLQMHYHRSEHWVVVKGTAEVTIQDQKQVVHEGQSIFVPKSAIHRVMNPGKVSLEIIEVQVGEYLGEDDIVRLEDIYGRLNNQESFKILLDAAKVSS